jgi:hypothetical protein
MMKEKKEVGPGLDLRAPEQLAHCLASHLGRGGRWAACGGRRVACRDTLRAGRGARLANS